MGFDEQSTRRIVRSVLATEAANLSTPRTTKRPRGYPPSSSEATAVRLRAKVDKAGGLVSPYDPFPVDNVQVIAGTYAGGLSLSDVHNDLKWNADDNALVYIEYVESLSTESTPYYHAYQVMCPA